MNNAQTFLNYCNDMMRLALPLFEKELAKCGLTKYQIGQGIDFPGVPHPVGKAWLTEPYGIYAKACNFQSGEDETIQITICPAEGWKPILSVASTSLDPVMFETTYSAEKDIVLIQKQIEKCFVPLKAG
jgi:hypothetical protein